jgi:tRNA threonylcarbamoyladenosine biosynthesis protein TsaB
MAYILCIETATPICSVALALHGNCLAKYSHPEANAHASELHLMVEKILQETRITLSDLAAIAISKGPGSYTGLRVGVSTAKGYAYALGIPVIAINTLSSLTSMAISSLAEPNDKAVFIPMIDARRMEVYTAIFNAELQILKETSALVVENNSFEEIAKHPKAYFFGNGANKCTSILNQANLQLMPGIHCCASGLCQLSYESYKNKTFENLAYFEPYYLKDFIGTQAKNKFFS